MFAPADVENRPHWHLTSPQGGGLFFRGEPEIQIFTLSLAPSAPVAGRAAPFSGALCRPLYAVLLSYGERSRSANFLFEFFFVADTDY